MIVFRLDELKTFAIKHPQARSPLDGWLRIASDMSWTNIIEVKANFPSVDGGVKNLYTVFNIKGNDYRLITEINYEQQTIAIVHIFTHAEYTKWSQL